MGLGISAMSKSWLRTAWYPPGGRAGGAPFDRHFGIPSGGGAAALHNEYVATIVAGYVEIPGGMVVVVKQDFPPTFVSHL
ncbi:MAG: hypothetical protein JWM47_1222 [Acidimicrobiales bacterium]|nr:hypothetical protein [Acidimicrobiales bacterium]